jgi:hypothetical protein
MNHAFSARSIAACLLLALATGAVLVRAMAADAPGLADPTRPPAGYLVGRNDAGLASGTQANGGNRALSADGASAASAPRAARSASAASAAQAAGSRLTLIRVATSGGYSSAVIDGRSVNLGDRVGDATVASIDEQGVVLRSARGWQRLWLASSAGKTSPVFTTMAPRPASAQPRGGKDMQ